MIRVCILDDQLKNRTLIEYYMKEYAELHSLKIEIQSFGHGFTLLQAEIEQVDLFLLDVEMPEISGIEVAKEIRKRYQNCEIIFITNYIQYALEGYEVQAFRYLLKPLEQKQFNEVADHVLNKIRKSKDVCITVKGRSDTIRLRVEEIIYAETYRGHVLIHTDKQSIDCYTTMEKLEKELKEFNFFRCHNAFLISMNEVSKVQLTDVILKNGSLIPVSKNRKKLFRQALTDFWGGKFL